MLGIVSDTHDNLAAVRAAVELLRRRNLTRIVHCGDITSIDTLECFKGLPLSFVFGNMDSDTAALSAKAYELGFEDIGTELSFEFKEKTFFVYHGTDRKLLKQVVDSGRYDYVLTGHTHLATDKRSGATRLINPGALSSAKQYSFAILDPVTDSLEFVEVASG